jgi:hypothetical protein
MKLLEAIRRFWNDLTGGENSPQKGDAGSGSDVHNDAENEGEAEAESLAGNAEDKGSPIGAFFADDGLEPSAEYIDNEEAEVETFIADTPDNDSEFIDGDHPDPDHECHVSVNIPSTDRRKPGKLRVCKGDICDYLEPGTELAFYGYFGDKITVEVVR